MSDRIPSYGEYQRKGSGGPEGKCRACGYEGPMYHSPTGYECGKCYSTDLLLKLKDGSTYDQEKRKIVPATTTV
jgi:hypothetical protein